MKIKLILVALSCFISFGWAENNAVLLDRVMKLQAHLKSASDPDQTLYDMGGFAQEMDVSLKEYAKQSAYRDVCHLKVIKSENFGDFISYDGYHYRQLISKYPNSPLVDDASYRLIYVIDSDSYNYEDLEVQKDKLEAFIKQFPKSNLYKEAKEKINAIEQTLKSGGPAIYD